MRPELVRKMTVEAVGAFALSFIGVGAILYGGPNSLVTVALAHGFVIAVMVCAAGHISGGHFNPAVTFGFLVTKRIPAYEAVGYWVAQLGAAVLGALAVRATLADNVPNINAGLTVLAPGVSVASGFVIEFILTFFLVFVIFGVAVDPRSGSFAAVAGIPIGLAISLDIMMGGPLTGASMNPSRTFGPDVVAGRFDNIWLYFVACPLGAAAAALLYHHLILARRED
jgi:aquaporin TIP